jgi:elongation factor G
MEYSRYSPCLPEVQEKLIHEYQRTLGNVAEEKKEKEKQKKKN